MRIALILLTAAVLLSIVLNADARTRFDQLHQLLQSGPIALPSRLHGNSGYLCYSRSQPDEPIYLVVEANATHIRRLRSNSATLNVLVEGSRIALLPSRLPIFNGVMLGGRSTPQNLAEALRSSGSRPSFFMGLSVHSPSNRHLAAILKVTQEQDLETAYANTETLEYLCIENEPEA